MYNNIERGKMKIKVFTYRDILKRVPIKKRLDAWRTHYGNYNSDGSKTIRTDFNSRAPKSNHINLERKTYRDYDSEKKLTHKYKEVYGNDDLGEFEIKIKTQYYPDGRTPKEVEKIKQYDSYIGEPYEMTKTNFSQKGVRETQSYRKGNYWNIFKYDEKGKNGVLLDSYDKYFHQDYLD